jgi:predicted esterase
MGAPVVVGVDNKEEFAPIQYFPRDVSSFKKCTAWVVWAHGLGDTSAGWAPTIEIVQSKMPHVCFTLPTAKPIRLTYGGGQRTVNAWFDFLDDEIANATQEGDARGMLSAGKALRRIAASSIRRTTGREPTEETWLRTVFAGFSQGSVAAFHAGITQGPSPVGAVLMVGGWLGAPLTVSQIAVRAGQAQVRKRPTYYFRDTTVLMLHGAVDDRVTPSAAQRSQREMKRLGIRNAELELFPGLNHGMDGKMMERVRLFLDDTLPAEDEL